MSNEEQSIICCLCNVELQPRKTTLKYMGFSFSAVLMRCPVCGLAYIPEDLATGKMLEVEQQLEVK